jgi:hypothetical protein
MGLNTEERQNVVFFTGYEVEHTVAYGMYTLFVVGTPPLNTILEWAEQSNVEQIYFGTSQSFNPKAMTHEEYQAWDEVILGCLRAGYWVALDFGVEHIEGVLESGYSEHQKFIPMISVKLPYINQLNYNATLKLDDRTWGATNPGVWTHHLQSLMSKDKFTYWDQYTKDSEITTK